MDSPNLYIRFSCHSMFSSQAPCKPFFCIKVHLYYTCLYLPWSDYLNFHMKYCDLHLKDNSEKANFITPKKHLPKARVLCFKESFYKYVGVIFPFSWTPIYLFTLNMNKNAAPKNVHGLDFLPNSYPFKGWFRNVLLVSSSLPKNQWFFKEFLP